MVGHYALGASAPDVVDEAAVLHGTFTLANLAETAFDTELNVLINAQGVARLHLPVFDVEHGLGIVMHSMQSDDDGRIVVVDDHVSLGILASCASVIS